jgi:phosphoglucosamine mutase
MASTLFGTDGIRETFGEPPLERQTVQTIGRELGRLLHEEHSQPQVVLAGDTRVSTETLAAWLVDGLRTMDVEIHYGGTLPTPAVALLTRQLRVPAGIAISASHNPASDNGIKLFDRQGRKWSRPMERRLEERVAAAEPADLKSLPLPPRSAVLGKQYVDYLLGLLPSPSTLAGMRLLLDGAHGAVTPLLPEICGRLQLDAVLLHATPDGRRINDGCGSTRPEAAGAAIREQGAEMGLTFDGDGDRVLLLDAAGQVHDGDAILYLWARHLHRSHALTPPRIVATTMSNLGLEQALTRTGIGVERCGVGDREVVDTLRKSGLTLGGEQSGHIVNLALASTGDGLLTGLQIAAIVRTSGHSLVEMLADFQTFPQILRNVRVREKPPFESNPAILEAQREVEAALGEGGRLLLRYSGTEPVARVMLEGPDRSTIERLAERLTSTITDQIGV